MGTCYNKTVMHSVPHGYTFKELIIAFLLIAIVILFVVAAVGPKRQLMKERDLVREGGVRDLMEMLLQMRVEDPANFSQIVGTVAAGQTMIGSAYECAGDLGVTCGDVVLRDTCIDLNEFGAGEYLDELPVDPSPEYLPRQTGYYLYLENSTLEVGACNPQLRNEIILEAHLD